MKFKSKQIVYNLYFTKSEVEDILYGLNDRRDYFVSLKDETLKVTILSLEILIEKIEKIISSFAEEDEVPVSLERSELVTVSHGLFNLSETYEEFKDWENLSRVWDFYKEIEDVLR